MPSACRPSKMAAGRSGRGRMCFRRRSRTADSWQIQPFEDFINAATVQSGIISGRPPKGHPLLTAVRIACIMAIREWNDEMKRTI